MNSESFSSLHRKASREATRAELAQALGEIESASHAVVLRSDTTKVYCYGDDVVCGEFADGLSDVRVVPMNGALKERLSRAKVQSYR